jgi:hypothetical protein
MQRHKKVKATLAALAIAGGAAVATFGPASPAMAFFSPPLLLEIHVNSATLAAKGASANVIVQVECSGSSTADVEVNLTQRAGSAIATGFGFTEIGCTTNRNQNVIVPVTAGPGKAFKKGPVAVDADVFACTPSFRICGDEQDQRTITIAR